MQLPVFAVFEKETNEVVTSYYCKTGRIYHDNTLSKPLKPGQQ
jgi:hypothetical protein